MALDPNTPRAKQAAVTRATILCAAREMFRAYGPDLVTVRMIARQSGTSTGAIFKHWPEGKEQLYAEAMGRRRITDEMGQKLLQLAKQADPVAAARIMTGRD